MGIMFLLGALLCFEQYNSSIKYEIEVALDNIFFVYTLAAAISASAFCSLFTGTEYSDGTIRNKLVVGHTRGTIYLSNLIVSMAAALLLCLSFILAAFAVGIPLIGFIKMETAIFLAVVGASFVTTLAFCSIFTLVSMLCQNRAVTTVICILGVFALLFAAAFINSKLEAPEYYDSYVMTDSSGVPMEVERVANPEYLRGTERQVYQFFLDFLPAGQVLQFCSHSAQHLWQMPLYSLIILLSTTAAGVFVFRRKDIK